MSGSTGWYLEARLVKRGVEGFKHEDELDCIRLTITASIMASVLRFGVGME